MNAITLHLLLVGAPLFLIGAVLAAVLRPARFATGAGFTASAASSSIGLILAGSLLATNQTSALVLGSFMPVGEIRFSVDGLAAFFLMLTFLVVLAVSVYSLGYMSQYEGRYNVRYFAVLLNLLSLSITLTIAADNAVLFLIAWEAMAILAYFMTVYRFDYPATPRAAFLMTVIMEIGAGMLILAFLLLYRYAGEFGFDAMHRAGSTIPESTRGLIFILALFGFGAKIGIVPLHIWLPEAHPAAPSNVSALLSGVVVSAGLYGLIRVLFILLGGGPVWWGIVCLIVGTLTAVLGVMYSMQTHDLKCLLSYSTVENMGIVLLLLGAGLIFGASGLPALASLAVLVGLYHTLNHAAFKGLLFLGAGALEFAIHSINMDHMGGLAKRMPWTGLWCFIGTLAIGAIPPLNGFVTEWLTLEVLFQGFHLTDALDKILLSLAGAALALTIAMSLTIFIKLYGLSFLGVARHAEAARADEVPVSMRWGMGILAVSCVGLGILPFLVVPLLDTITTPLWGTAVTSYVVAGLILIPYDEHFSAASPTYLAFMLPILVLLPVGIGALWGRFRMKRVDRVWIGGLPALRPTMQYSPLGFSNAIRIIFGWIYRPQPNGASAAFPYSSYFVRSTGYRSHIFPFVERFLYLPLIKGAKWVSRYAVRFQSGSLNRYMAYIFLLLLVALLFGI